ncbi:hypothetical protein EJ04DRAFT_502094 [Polyplosphaeria fusca]|uniref:Rhodopsin domain-containing protein n=1 Tax=Polyplosphaeria fusca TaxID=682080 RepID=A0A9P4QPZ7_9PLEO|nr:hypothetical protein EJ04DRAFT_502094 [Polyplosphaeria fusca]
MASVYPPVTRGESLNVLSWVLLSVTILTQITRWATKYFIVRKFFHDWDDLVAFLALIFSAALTIAISLQTANGLGSHFGDLTRSEQVGWQKAAYASNILFIATLWAGKSATVFHMQQINPFTWRFYSSVGVNVFVGLWAFTALLASCLQCPSPRWQSVERQNCVNRTALYTYIDASNLVTEALILLLPLIVLSDIKITLQRKLAILSCFMLRIFVIIGIVVQIVYSAKGVYTSSDPTYDSWKRTICLQIVQNFCVISGSVPYLKPFYMGLQSGLIRSDDMRRTGLTTAEYTQMSAEGRVSSKNDNGQIVSTHASERANASGASSTR